ncbi:class I SAM-dependent methyltransferase [Lysinibacillus sp. G4S2]|uniref:class I SAM-dependent methyltransferase n=1 Tax=Lysinibacillus sp. G4S2 TaxID=3055859 RepID=UPI0025A1C9F6|nr:class I SAM-dependent methyltransferase [Lysinibacillus sp. G4S2]MDM5246499.1 class I SAM-dependent methyltransferase [Lysinibacillus sp. G4S2]
MTKVKINDYGYYEIAKRPSQEELNEYYTKTYYQNNKGSYSHEYTIEEKKYFNNHLEQKEIIIRNFFESKNNKLFSELSLLDIGAGEGYCLNYFSNLGLNVTGVDFSTHGCEIHNPRQLKNLLVGDTMDVIDNLAIGGKSFDIITMNNVLEHVLDPGKLLEKLRKIMNKNSLLIIEVPNDFSELQQYLLKTNKIDTEFWIAIPDHLSYFNKDGLVNLCNSFGFEKYQLYSDYPIDLNLLLESSNYIKNAAIGKDIHKQRVEIENYLHSKSPEKLLEIYKIFAEMGIGRQIVGYFSFDSTFIDK